MTSRRHMLKSSLVLAAGAIGFGAARRAAGGIDVSAARPGSNGRLPRSLSLAARNVHASVDGMPAGHGPGGGGRSTVSGELVDPGGAPLGRFFGVATAFDTGDPGALPSVETHTFQMPDGTIHGMGTVVPGAEPVFAIVGGTGRYLGARGSYVAEHAAEELGGDGSAAFTITFAR